MSAVDVVVVRVEASKLLYFFHFSVKSEIEAIFPKWVQKLLSILSTA